jgi:hypothetical protein
VDQQTKGRRETSRYKDHPRITWFGIGGTVAYVDYTGATTSYFIGGSDTYDGEFMILPPEDRNYGAMHGFNTMDEGIERALQLAS